MNNLDPIIKRANKFFDSHIFEVYTQPTHDNDFSMPTNVKIVLTGVKDYIVIGEKKPHIQYTIYILPTNTQSDSFNSLWSNLYGNELPITTSSIEYSELRFIMNLKLENFLKYFGIDANVICTKVINEVEPMKLNESLIVESKLDNVVRTIVKDILGLIKFQRNGQFVLPEDIRIEDQTYKFSNLPEFTIELEVLESDTVDRFDVECAYYKEEDVITIDIVINPDVKYSILYDIVGELNEQVRHEIEHMVQNVRGIELPEKEPKSPVKYYTQSHEIGAQIAGFKRKAKITKQPYEKVVRNWFEDNKHKHRMTPKQADKVIQQIIQNS
jgi:hypothetical protein